MLPSMILPFLGSPARKFSKYCKPTTTVSKNRAAAASTVFLKQVLVRILLVKAYEVSFTLVECEPFALA